MHGQNAIHRRKGWYGKFQNFSSLKEFSLEDPFRSLLLPFLYPSPLSLQRKSILVYIRFRYSSMCEGECVSYFQYRRSSCARACVRVYIVHTHAHPDTRVSTCKYLWSEKRDVGRWKNKVGILCTELSKDGGTSLSTNTPGSDLCNNALFVMSLSILNFNVGDHSGVTTVSSGCSAMAESAHTVSLLVSLTFCIETVFWKNHLAEWCEKQWVSAKRTRCVTCVNTHAGISKKYETVAFSQPW